MFIWDFNPIPERPRGNTECPRLYGLFPDPRGCGRFFKCVNGTATEDQCGTTLIFDDKEKVCKDMTKEEIENCQEPNLLGCTDCKFIEVLQLKNIFYVYNLVWFGFIRNWRYIHNIVIGNCIMAKNELN